MFFSKSCEYGLRATLFIVKKSILKEKVGLEEISQAIDSPKAFTAKILQTLVKQNIIDSIKGPYGGFLISNERLKKNTLNDVVLALDGDKIYIKCGLGLKKCDSKKPCPMHFEFIKIRDELKEILKKKKLNEILLTKETHQDFLLKL